MVEIVMEVEERFSVKLNDAACAQARTVADLAALVLAQLPRSAAPCPTARTFFELRRQMVALTGVDRRQVRPTTRVQALFPSGLRRPWRTLRQANPRLPPLVASSAVDGTMLLATALMVLVSPAAIGIVWARHGAAVGALAVLLAAVAAAILVRLSTQVGWRLPPHAQTVGDIVRFTSPISPISPMHGRPGTRLLTQLHVLEEVRRITASHLGLPLEKVRADSDFLKDLHAG